MDQLHVLCDSPCALWDFDIPDDIVQVTIDPITGHRAPDDMTSTVQALFGKVAEPR